MEWFRFCGERVTRVAGSAVCVIWKRDLGSGMGGGRDKDSVAIAFIVQGLSIYGETRERVSNMFCSR